MCDILELSMLLKKIPCDVIREHIIPYTFQVQPKELCDDIFSIPMMGQVESLNVSVASGICLYEINRQKT